MGLYVEFDISDYGYGSEVQGTVAGMFPIYTTMDFAPACEAFVKTFIEVATELVPVDTGYLRSTINATTDGFHCSAEATAEYAEYVEYGTFRMEAQPYFTPALEMAMSVFIQIADEIVNTAKQEIMKQVLDGVHKMEIASSGSPSAVFIGILAMIIIMFIVEIVSDFFKDIFGDDEKASLPTITIMT